MTRIASVLWCRRGSTALLVAAVLVTAAPTDANAAPIAWAVGADGTIVTSTDRGATWTPQASGISQDLRGVDFFDAMHGVAVGVGGNLLRTIDGGATWVSRTSGVATALNDVVLASPTKGVAVGAGGNGTFTLDGGGTWTPIVFVSSPDLEALTMTTGSTVLAVGDARLWSRSTDGGITWSAVTTTGAISPNPPLNWLGVTGTGGSTAMAVGGDQIGGMYTRFNGTIWSAPTYIGSFAPVPTAAGFQLSDVAYTGSAIVAVGLGGIVTRSTDGGASWTAPTSIAPFDLLDVDFFDAVNGLAVGAAGKVFRTTDGGMTWSAPISAAGVNLYALDFTDGPGSAIPEPESHLLVLLALVACTVLQLTAGLRPLRSRVDSEFGAPPWGPASADQLTNIHPRFADSAIRPVISARSSPGSNGLRRNPLTPAAASSAGSTASA